MDSEALKSRLKYNINYLKRDRNVSKCVTKEAEINSLHSMLIKNFTSHLYLAQTIVVKIKYGF